MEAEGIKLTITYQPVAAIKDSPRNARVHSKPQIRKIAGSIKAFGFNNPVLLDESNTIIAGHGRVAAARLWPARFLVQVES